MRRFASVLAVYVLASSWAFAAQSACHGRVAQGRLTAGVQLPAAGKNFAAYSTAGVALGRTYVHSQVRDVILEAYTALETSAPQKLFIYGETGRKEGGLFKPHRTHQNGLSVDFMVPVKNGKGDSVPLPASPLNKYGYAIEFDQDGKAGDLAIDFEALAEHLYQLAVAARKNNAPVSLVIFDPPLLPKLFATRRGPYLQKSLPFMKGKAWVRHDEHYHVDFAIPCKPLKR